MRPLGVCYPPSHSQNSLFFLVVITQVKVRKLQALMQNPCMPHSIKTGLYLDFLQNSFPAWFLSSKTNLSLYLWSFQSHIPPKKRSCCKLWIYPEFPNILVTGPHFLDCANIYFVTVVSCSKGQAISSQRLSKWVTQYISLCYLLATVPLPLTVKTFSTRAQATSACFQKMPVIQNLQDSYVKQSIHVCQTL